MRLFRVLDENGHICYAAGEGPEFHAVRGDSPSGFTPSLEQVNPRKILPPVDPPMIFAIGLNYRAHAIETGKPIPDAPVVFAKAPTSVIGPGETILLPAAGPECVDYEVELAVVIGRRARNVKAEQAHQYILGYTIANDVSARDWQQRLGQWVRAKSFDTFCPLGPCIQTDIDPADLRLTTTVNDQVMQDSRTSDLIFNVPQLVEFLSADLTLLPGTVILTGTPSGVGVARKPPVYLRPGDTVTCSIEGIGKLTNPVAAADGAVITGEAAQAWGR